MKILTLHLFQFNLILNESLNLNILIHDQTYSFQINKINFFKYITSNAEYFKYINLFRKNFFNSKKLIIY